MDWGSTRPHKEWSAVPEACGQEFLVPQMVNSLPAMQETQVQSAGLEDHLERKWQLTPVFLPGKRVDRGAWRTTVHGVAKSQT